MLALALFLAAAPITVTIGERVETTVTGRYRSAAVTDAAIAQLEDLGEGRLRIEGANEGATTVVVTRESGATESIELRVARPKKLAKLPDGRRWTLAPGELIDFEAAGWKVESADPEIAEVAVIGRRVVISARAEGESVLISARSPLGKVTRLNVTVRRKSPP